MVLYIVIISLLSLSIGYFLYGKFIAKNLYLDDNRKTPACEINDGVDYVPAKASMLLGQHFSAIAAAGPIVGPILAAIWFGWLPALLWIILGSIFIGGVHDFTSLVASIRHKASSIGEIIKKYMSPVSYKLFLIFVWIALIYVIIAFTDITSHTFTYTTSDIAYGPSVVFASFLYLVLGIIMGILLYKLKLNLKIATIIFIPLVIFSIWYSRHIPIYLSNFLSSISIKKWDIILLVYCFIASVIPMWLLLQPRGYLGGWFLYLTIITALLGSIFGGYSIKYPAINLNGLKSAFNGQFIFPILFITVACGACSGFHGIVSSGTTSKQIRYESDTKIVGYGAMILEALVAVLALATVIMLEKNNSLINTDPNLIYANGIAKYMKLIGINYNFALTFALLAFSTFVYDTLDVCTRLARYILQELFNWNNRTGAYFATFITVFIAFIILITTKEKGYLVAWPIFGTSNQLLASLILLAITVWLIKEGKKYIYTLIPMAFMMFMTLWSLLLQITKFIKALTEKFIISSQLWVSGIVGLILFLLAIWLVWEAVKAIRYHISSSKNAFKTK